MFYVFRKTVALLGKRAVVKLFVFFGMTTFTNLFSMVPLAVMMPLFRVIADPGKKTLPEKMSKLLPDNLAQQINSLLNQTEVQIIIFALLITVTVLMAIQIYITAFSKERLRAFVAEEKIKLSNVLFKNYLQSAEFNYQNPIERIKAGCQALAFLLTYLIEGLGVLLTMVILCVSIVYGFSLPGLALVASLLTFTIISTLLIQPKLREINYETQARINRDYRRLKDSMYAIKEIKALGRETHFFKKYHSNLLAAEKQEIARNKINRLIELLGPVGRFGSMGIGIMVALYTLPIEALSTFLLAFLLLSMKLGSILDGMVGNIRSVYESSQGLLLQYKTMLHYSQRADTTVGSEKAILENNIEFKDLSFEYRNYDDDDYDDYETIALARQQKKAARTTTVFEGLNFKIKKGQYVGIIGKNGTGKSTILDILVGLLQPSAGHVLIDGQPLTEIDQKIWRSQINYVVQNPHMVSESVLYNITLGLEEEEIDHQKLDTAIRLTRLEQIIQQLPNGINSVLGILGTKISGGQAQRISLARALYQDSPILLLDEATRAIDASTEREIMTDIAAWHGEKTIIIISHRVETLKRCDTILVIDNKKLLAQGNYKELSQTCELFREFVNISDDYAQPAKVKTRVETISPSIF